MDSIIQHYVVVLLQRLERVADRWILSSLDQSEGGIVLANAGLGNIFDRVLTELVSKIKNMNMDRTELGCLHAIILFNPGH